MITILINEFTTFISVKIFDNGQGQLPRVRTASSLSHFRKIIGEEIRHFGRSNVRIERENTGRFGSLTWGVIVSAKNSPTC
jgi:hypothetical protein